MKKLPFIALLLATGTALAQDTPSPLPTNAFMGRAFANLGTPPNGTVYFCPNCTSAAPCAAGGTGAYAYRVAGAWNCSAESGTFGSSMLLSDGTAAAPSFSFSAQSTLGMYRGGSNVLAFSAGSAFTFGSAVCCAGLGLPSSAVIGWKSSTSETAGEDLTLFRDAANVLAQRNGTSAQAFNIYNTFTDASNYGRFAIVNTTTQTDLIGQTLGTGTGGLHSVQGGKIKSLTDAAAAVAVERCAVPTSDSVGGEIIWTTESTDATDFRATQGRIRFAGVNKAGTTTCTINVVGTDLTASSNANTLVCTWTNVAASTNCDLSLTCTDNTAGGQTMAVNYRLDMPIPQTCTPQ